MTTLHRKYLNFIFIAVFNANAISHDTNRFLEDYKIITFKDKEFMVGYHGHFDVKFVDLPFLVMKKILAKNYLRQL